MNTLSQWSQPYLIPICIDLICVFTQCFLRTFHKYGFDKDLKSHGSGQEVSETKLDTFTRLLIPTEDQKNGVEGFFLVFLVFATRSQCHNC